MPPARRPPRDAPVDDAEPYCPELDGGVIAELEATGAAVLTDVEERVGASRDFWPLAQRWTLAGRDSPRPAAVVRPDSPEAVAAVLAVCNERSVPVTAAGGRSGVCGGAVPLYGGVALDTTALAGIRDVDAISGLVEAGAGTFGHELEAALVPHGLAVGHCPQSIELSTVGGWLACRGAGQFSTRYGKIEDIVAGLEVCLADGRVVRTGGLAGAGPRSATGPDLTALFVGSEGTLGVITSALLRAHALPPTERRAAFSFPAFSDGLEALRRTLRSGATPAVVRLYDAAESTRLYDRPGCILLALDEGEEPVVTAAMALLTRFSLAAGGGQESNELVASWLERRNDVSFLAGLLRAGIVVDTVEVAARWTALEALYTEVTEALTSVPGCLAASAHVSHAYPDGGCLYFSFAGRGSDPSDDEWAEQYYSSSLEAVMTATLSLDGSISHHHGIGHVRGGHLARALGAGHAVLAQLKASLDPKGILNPGKLGLGSPFGPPPSLSAAR